MQVLLDRIRSTDDPLAALLASPSLSPSERQRASDIPVAPAIAAVGQGACVLLKSDLPELYRNVDTAPVSLFAWGDTSCLYAPTLAIVGTRNATTYGKAVAQKFAEAIARAGVTIVSGGALGIDAAAHKGALAVGGKTAAVFLTGIERAYPRVHFGLFEQIKANGCVLSQFPVGAMYSREFRPLLRNQTVAALSSAILVVEAPEKSGALSTAARGNELGRHVFVVPSNVDNVNFRGSHGLIRDGATLVDHPDQVLEAMDLEPVGIETTRPELTPVQARILAVMSPVPLACEFIVEKTGLNTAEVLSELTMLEMDGHIIRDAGGFALCP
jgi:DNA processing protein